MKRLILATTLALTTIAAHTQTPVKRIQNARTIFAEGVWAGDTLYLAGQMASPVTPADAAKGTPADYGDTKAQAASVFSKIQKLLQAQGLDMGDVVKMTIFMAPDPKTGKMDFAAMNGEYAKYFGTADQPNKPARSAVQVAALATTWGLLEVEVIAVKSK